MTKNIIRCQRSFAEFGVSLRGTKCRSNLGAFDDLCVKSISSETQEIASSFALLIPRNDTGANKANSSQ